MKKVLISKPQNYNNSSEHPSHPIITINGNKPDFGFIMLKTETFEMNGTWGRMANRVGRITNRVAELEKIVTQFNLKEGDDFSTKVMPVRLIVKEQTEPFYEGQEPKINPTTGEVVTHDGKEVYRNTVVVAEGSDQQDDLRMTDRTEVTNLSSVPNTEFADAGKK